MMKSISRFILYSVIISLFMSCFRELEAESTQKTGVPVQVSMHIKVPSFTSPQGATRSATEPAADDSGFKVHLVEQDEQKAQTRSSGTTSLYNLWVLQFASDNTVRKISKIANVPAPVKDMITIDAELFTGSNQTIYLVALGKQYESIDLSGVTNISELENFAIPFVKYENGMAIPIITEEEDIPYQGSQSGLTIVQIEKGGRGLIEYDPSMNFSGAINIRAMVSKVSANLSFDVSDMAPYLLMLNNVPTSFAINNPSYIASGFANMPAIEIASGSLTEGNRHTYSWYMAPNPQGVVSTITSESSRYYYIQKNGTPTGKAPKNGTYLNFWASSNISSDTYAQYYIFLGNNTTNDFNIYANTSYNLRSDINSIEYLTDKRIVYGKLVQSIDFAATERVGTIALAHKIRIDGNYSFDAHPDMRPIEISALRGTVKIEVLRSATDTQPIALADSWLKLSAYPNYTEAVNKQRVADPEGLVTSITKNATIPSVYKFYLYSDEYLEYAPSMDAAQSKNRDLYIRFTFHVSALVLDDVTTVKMTQRPAFYLGQFGGTFNEDTGEYSDGLVFESIKELNAYVEYLSYYDSPEKINTGIYDAPYNVLFETYKVGDLRNGKETTLRGAMNIGNKKFKTSSKLTAEEPKFVGGKLDLYQYSIQKLNYFSARYCYDKNRDTNGDGVINPEEYHWYMPAYIQNQAFVFNAFGNLRNAIHSNTTLVSISQNESNDTYTSASYDFKSKTGGYSNMVTPRCVRDVPTVLGMPGGFKAYAEDGYAVIDAMGMSPSVREDRATNPQLIINDRGRVIRHYEPGGITATSSTVMSKVSARFRVAPFDIDTLGIERNYNVSSNGLMSWAHASGYNQVGNSWVMSEESNPLGTAQTGCPMYAGKSGNEAGQWRLPTESELALIEIMDATLVKTAPDTGYKALTTSQYPTNTNSAVYYWSSTESSASSDQPITSALCMNCKISYQNGLLTTYTKRQFSIITKTGKYFVRCIRDLPER